MRYLAATMALAAAIAPQAAASLVRVPRGHDGIDAILAGRSHTASSLDVRATATTELYYNATDPYGNPVFKDDIDTSGPTGNGKPTVQCHDPSKHLSTDSLRAHPRIIAPGYMWDCLPGRIKSDAYLQAMNASVFANASAWYSQPPVNYSIDGGYAGSGILDVSRQVQQRVRAWSYVYRLTKDKKWSKRVWRELRVAAGNTSQPFGQGPSPQPDQHWNPSHFLDTGEMTAAFAIGYDWVYDAWSPKQREALRWSIITLGLKPGQAAYAGDASTGWWTQASNGFGNWNCVCNSGLLLGALAIKGDDKDDPEQTAGSVFKSALGNIKDNCFQGPYADGTWPETPNYWYFGTNAAVRAESALISATGSNQGLSTSFWKTGKFHMYVAGNAGLFAYGDHGPNKFSTNANGMLWWGKQYKRPEFTLYQRDRADALGDPLALFWYDETAKGAFWNGKELDQYFDKSGGNGTWASMRSSWSDFNGLYIGMKASKLLGHQTHGDLDGGDFVIDALGTRWAGEFGSAQYLSPGYFTSEDQTAQRWTYYRKRTMGQNTILVDGKDQNVEAVPTSRFGSSESAKQSASVGYKPSADDTAFFVTDLSGQYNASAGSVKRGIRPLNARRQVLQQDEIAGSVGKKRLQWRVHTNATVDLSSDGRTATLTIDSLHNPNAATKLSIHMPKKTLKVSLLSPADARFKTNTPAGKGKAYTNTFNNPSNDGVTTLSVALTPGKDQKLQTWWQPQWDDLDDDDEKRPKDVALDDWSLTSHDE